MAALLITIILTIGISAVCSLLEALILSTTVAEIEQLKRAQPKRGLLLEKFKVNIDETSSAILSLNTIANTLGAVVVGGLVAEVFGPHNLIYFSLGMTVAILVLGEILPKNAGIVYRKALQRNIIYLLWFVRLVMLPLVWFCKHIVRSLIKHKIIHETSHEEIQILAEKSAKEGKLGKDESSVIANILKLNSIYLNTIMTPRTVISALNEDMTVADVLEEIPNIPFARLPIYKNNIDDITGLVRRRDILEAKANAKEHLPLTTFKDEVLFIPETATGADALKQFLAKNKQMAIVVDEFGSIAGVITMEDIFECILGREIYEADDIAVNMRELALKRKSLGKSSSPFTSETEM